MEVAPLGTQGLSACLSCHPSPSELSRAGAPRAQTQATHWPLLPLAETPSQLGPLGVRRLSRNIRESRRVGEQESPRGTK